MHCWARTSHRRPHGSRACWPRPGCRTPARRRRRSAASPPRSAAPAGSPSSRRRRPRRSGRGSPTRCWSSPDRPGSRTSGLPRSRTACRATRCGTAPTGPRGSSASPWSWRGSRADATSTPSSSRTGSTTPSDAPRTSTGSRWRWGAPPAAGRGRVALPAIVGLRHHAEAWADLRAALPLDPFEVPLVPPSVPGIRLWQALRARIRAGGGRVQVGEQVHRIEVVDGRVVAVELEAATRVHRITTDAVVLATGGIAGGGLIGTVDGRLVEPLLGLPVETPPQDDWLRREALDPAGHPVESAGIRTDARLHPLDAEGRTLRERVRGRCAPRRPARPAGAMRRRRRGRLRAGAPRRRSSTARPPAADAPTPVGASSRSRRTAR